MGYILPITHYNYKQYQNRMQESKESPHFISSPYKVVFHQINSDYDEVKAEEFHELNLELKDVPNKGIKNMYHISKGKKAQLTGKGGYINDQI